MTRLELKLIGSFTLESGPVYSYKLHTGNFSIKNIRVVEDQLIKSLDGDVKGAAFVTVLENNYIKVADKLGDIIDQITV